MSWFGWTSLRHVNGASGANTSGQQPDWARVASPSYAKCEDVCHHDLARGCLVGDLLSGSDGPFKPPKIFGHPFGPRQIP